MSITTEVTAVEEDVKSFFNSPIFHNHVRTWTFVILAAFLIGFLYVHESNAAASQTALVDQMVTQQSTVQSNLDKQIQALHDDTKTQVAQIQQQLQETQTVAQAIAAIKTNIPPVTITPIVTQPATATTPAQTTANDKADTNLPVATITGIDLKTLSDNALTCKAQAVQLNSCQQDVVLEQKKEASLQTEVDGLKKIKTPPAWKTTLITIGHVAIGILVGKAL